MSILGTKLEEAIQNKKNDINTFVWKYARVNYNTEQREVKLVDVPEEELKQFYTHCNSMLYQRDSKIPGRYVLMELIKEQREKCNVELFLKGLETGELSGKNPYPRHTYLQDLRSYLTSNKEKFPPSDYDKIYITACTSGLPREFQKLTIADVTAGCLDQLGIFRRKHLTFSFILKMGIYLTPHELKELGEEEGKTKIEILKERLGLKPDIKISIKSSGLSLTEFKAMLNLKSVKYSQLTTNQLLALRNKVLFRLENEVQFHIEQWEELKRQIELVAKHKGYTL